MNFSSISGILLSAAAVIWVALIIPNWFQAQENRRLNRNSRAQEKAKIKSSFSRGALQEPNSKVVVFARAMKFRNTAFLFISLSVALFFAGSYAADFMALTTTFAVITSLLGVLLLRRSSVIKRSLLLESIQRRSRAKAPRLTVRFEEDAAPAAIETGWKPNEMPAPMHTLNRNGTLESPTLADVTKLEAKPVTVSAETIDEILKRRRAI